MAEPKNTKSVTVRKPKQAVQKNDVESLISQAIAGNVSIETMEKLFSLREKVKAEQAREAFTQAMSDFQRNCPVIEKTKKVLNKDGVSVRYQFAPIDSIVKQIQKPLADAGLAYTWTVKNEPEMVTAICKVTHFLGHSEESSFQIPVDKEGYMTAPQKVASALTFAKRYSLCNALGISTGDEDTDATDVKKEPTPKSDKAKIVFLLRTLGRETKDKDSIQLAVRELTLTELKDENLAEIVGRLEVLVKEKNEDTEIQ